MFNVLKTKKTLDSLLVLEKTENRAFMAAIQIQNLLIPPAAGTGDLGTGCEQVRGWKAVLPGSPAPARGLYLEPQAPALGLHSGMWETQWAASHKTQVRNFVGLQKGWQLLTSGTAVRRGQGGK